MAYIPSHQELKDHPKTRRAARRCDVSIPTMVGHLHLLWWWALDHGPDGDLSRFESEDLADAAMWEGDPEEFVKALVDCGPGGSEGFLTSDGVLHDWAEYGGKYGQRVQAARKAAAVRWQSNGNATASPEQPLDGPECDRNADAMRPHNEGNAAGNAEERRGEESKEEPPPSTDVDDAKERFEEHFWPIYPKMPNGSKPEKGKALQQWRKLTLEQQRRAVRGARNIAAADTIPKHAHRFLRQDTAGEFPFDDWQEAPVSDLPMGPDHPRFGGVTSD